MKTLIQAKRVFKQFNGENQCWKGEKKMLALVITSVLLPSAFASEVILFFVFF